MARPKEFDRADVLDRSMRVFWEKGYECASMQDLVTAMGIGRASLYDTFGSKEDLFAEAMERYAEKMETEMLAPLRTSGSAMSCLENFFRKTLDSLESAEQPCCLMIKAAVGRAGEDEELAAGIRGFMKNCEDALCALLSRAKAEGELDSDSNPRAIARMLRTVLHGLSISANLGQDRRAMREVIRTAMKAC